MKSYKLLFPMNINFLAQKYYIPVEEMPESVKQLGIYEPNKGFSMMTTQSLIDRKEGYYISLPSWHDAKILACFIEKAFDSPLPNREPIIDVYDIARKIGDPLTLEPELEKRLERVLEPSEDPWLTFTRQNYLCTIERWMLAEYRFRCWYDEASKTRCANSCTIIEGFGLPRDILDLARISIRFSHEFMTASCDSFRVMIDLNQYLSLSSPISAKLYEIICGVKRDSKSWRINESALANRVFFESESDSFKTSIRYQELKGAVDEVCQKLRVRYSWENGYFQFNF